MNEHVEMQGGPHRRLLPAGLVCAARGSCCAGRAALAALRGVGGGGLAPGGGPGALLCWASS